MTTTSSSHPDAKLQVGRLPHRIDLPRLRCPCCEQIVSPLPALHSIEPCRTCRRPLALVRTMLLQRAYRLANLLELIGSGYGVATSILVIAFVLSGMDVRTFAKGVTILMFVIGSVLLVDGTLSTRTAINRSWRRLRFGATARVIGAGKLAAGLVAMSLTVIGLSL